MHKIVKCLQELHCIYRLDLILQFKNAYCYVANKFESPMTYNHVTNNYTMMLLFCLLNAPCFISNI